MVKLRCELRSKYNDNIKCVQTFDPNSYPNSGQIGVELRLKLRSSWRSSWGCLKHPNVRAVSAVSHVATRDVRIISGYSESLRSTSTSSCMHHSQETLEVLMAHSIFLSLITEPYNTTTSTMFLIFLCL
jgi:hypothetical protein